MCMVFVYKGEGAFRNRNFLLSEISYFKCVQNFPFNFQAPVRNKLLLKFRRNVRCAIAQN